MKKKWIITIIVLTILLSLIRIGIYLYNNYSAWKNSCENLNKYANCGIFDCSIKGYFTNRNLCH